MYLSVYGVLRRYLKLVPVKKYKKGTKNYFVKTIWNSVSAQIPLKIVLHLVHD